MAASSLKDRPRGHTMLATTNTLTPCDAEKWLFAVDREPPFVGHTSDQAGNKPTLNVAIAVLRPPDRTITHSPHPRIASSTDFHFLTHR